MVNETYGDGAPRARALVEARMLIEVPRGDGGADYIGIADWILKANEALAGLRAQNTWVATQISTLTARQADRDRAEQESARTASGSMKTWRREMDQSLADLRAQIAALGQRLNQTLEAVDTLTAAVAGQGAGGSVRQSEDGIAHHTHAQNYRAIRDQQIRMLLQHVRTLDGKALGNREKAEFMADVCAELFGPKQAAADDVIDRLAERYYVTGIQHSLADLCAEVRTLREKTSHGRPQRWEFGCAPGAAVEAGWQEEWPNAVQDGVVEFVVAPAYIVDDGTVLVNQMVHTVRPDGEAP
jgi:hypothetical protein